ncbi:hypothetical protein R3I94_021638 [Phoxinus phoxinus]
MVFTEPEEDSDLEETCREETCPELMMDPSPTLMWDYMNCVEEIHEENKIIKDKTEEINEEGYRSKEVQNMALLTKQKQEQLNKRKYLAASSKLDNTAREMKKVHSVSHLKPSHTSKCNKRLYG